MTLYIDVNLDLDALVLAEQPDPSRYALEMSRETADRRCHESGAQLRTDRPPEVVIGRGIDPLTGRDVVMVASRWACVGSDALAEADRGR